MLNTRRTVEMTANVAIIAVCGLLCWILFHRPNPKHDIERAEASLAGKRLPSLSGYAWPQPQETLVLAIKKDCPYCEQSMPFYRQLAQMEKQGKLKAHLVAVMPDTEERGKPVLEQAGVDLDANYKKNLAAFNVHGTPTLLLADASGRVEKAWIGTLQPQDQNSVLAAVRR